MYKIFSSPLSYVGGKRFLVPTLLTCGIPTARERFCSPFMGGGAMELNLAYRGYPVSAYDVNHNIVNFWNVYLSDADKVVARAKKILKTCTREDVQKQKQNRARGDSVYFPTLSPLDNAAWLLIFLKVSFSSNLTGNWVRAWIVEDGILYTGHRKKSWGVEKESKEFMFHCDNPNKESYHARLDYDVYSSLPLTVGHGDFRDTLARHEADFLYLDPPYFGSENLYESSTEGFDHHALFSILDSRGRWLLSYEDCKPARELYHGYRWLEVDRLHGFNHKDKALTELLIFAHDVEMPACQEGLF